MTKQRRQVSQCAWDGTASLCYIGGFLCVRSLLTYMGVPPPTLVADALSGMSFLVIGLSWFLWKTRREYD